MAEPTNEADTTAETTADAAETTTPETTSTETTAPAGARDPGAVERALRSEREATRAARREAREARDALGAVTERAEAAEARVSELEAQLATARSEAARNDALLLRYTVAADKGLDLAVARRLTGTTAEELSADADELLRLLGSGRSRATAEDFDGGRREPAPTKGTPEQEHQRWLAQLLGGRTPGEDA